MKLPYVCNKNNIENGQYLISRIEKYNVISIDIFDTTVIRVVDDPRDVFLNLSKLYKGYGLKDYYQRRISAQKEADLQHGAYTDIKKIYSCFYLDDEEEILLSERFNCTKNQIIDSLIELEIQQEIRCSVRNEAIQELITYCNAHGKKVYFLSDMYLRSSDLRKILNKIGISGNFQILVSCEEGKTKANGSLFQALRDRIGNSAKVIHIGDNLRSDIFEPSIHFNIKSIYLRQVKKCAEKFFIYTDLHRNSPLYRFGYDYLGPVYLLFCKWIFSQASANKIEKLLFLTREGAFIKKLYDMIYFPNGDKDSVHSDVLFISRRSIVTAMSDLDWDMVLNFFRGTKSNLLEFADAFEISAEYINDIAKRFHINEKVPLSSYDEFKEILSSMKPLCIGYSMKQRPLLVQYLNNIGLECKVGLVDIGWNGTMQHCIEKLCDIEGIKYDINGFYFALWPNEKYKKSSKAGFLCSTNDSKNMFALENAAYVFENSMMTDLGTTIKYERGEYGMVVPVTEKVEQQKDKEIQIIQSGIFDFVRNHNRYKDVLELSEKEVIENLLKVLKYPTMELSVAVGNIRWSDINTEKYIAKPDKLLSYILHPHEFKSDLQSSGWNSAFCRRLFKIPLPYFYFYKVLKGVR